MLNFTVVNVKRNMKYDKKKQEIIKKHSFTSLKNVYDCMDEYAEHMVQKTARELYNAIDYSPDKTRENFAKIINLINKEL